MSRWQTRQRALLAPLRSVEPHSRLYILLVLLGWFTVFHLFYVDLSPPEPLLPSGSLPLTSSPRLVILQTIFAPPTTATSLLMSLVGQGWPERPIYRASVRGHERYAATWGYGYRLETKRWVEKGEGVRVPFLNKVHAILSVARDELGKGDQGAEWILTADSDTLTLDPSIPLHLFLPPSYQDPPPSMLANQDHNGLNAGVFFWRVNPRLITFLESLLSYEPLIYASTGRHASDQHLTGYALQQPDQADFAAGFYEIPQRWVNGYFVQQTEVGDEGWDPAAVIHLVNWRKWQEDWPETVVKPVDEVYAKAEVQAEAMGTGVREALMLTDTYKEAKAVTLAWWKHSARAGIDNMVFNEY